MMVGLARGALYTIGTLGMGHTARQPQHVDRWFESTSIIKLDIGVKGYRSSCECFLRHSESCTRSARLYDTMSNASSF